MKILKTTHNLTEIRIIKKIVYLQPFKVVMINYKEILETEHSLDPENWVNMRSLAHSMVDDMMDYLQGIKEQKAWQPTTAEVRASFEKTLPVSATAPSEIYQDFKKNILPYNKGNVHPRFFSWVEGGGTPLGMMADMLAAGMNANVTIGDHSAMYVDKQVVEWCKEMINFPKNSSGYLATGGSSANITALIVAKNNLNEGFIKKHGLQNFESQLIIYCSSETHNCIVKAAEIIGLGYENVRKISTKADFTINLDELKSEIEKDKKSGNLPFVIVGNAGTVNTAAIDDLEALYEISKSNNIWYHIDGAVGAFAKIVPEYSQKLLAIEKADSIALDLHKWLYMPYEIACVLIKDTQKHRFAFAPASAASYLAGHERGLASGPDSLANYGMDLSRNFKALKAWMSFREHGQDKYRIMLRQNIAQAYYLANLIENSVCLELLSPVSMNIVCFRFFDKSLNQEQLNALNKEILMQLHESGVATPSYTVLNGKYAIRAAITNHRSRKIDFDMMIAEIIKIGNRIEN